MQIVGNKICQVCLELNDKRNEECIRCKCPLRSYITEGKGVVDNVDAVIQNKKTPIKYRFTFGENRDV
jgi:hypothetical protein